MGARIVQNNTERIFKLYTARAISLADETMDAGEALSDLLVPVRRGWLKKSKKRTGKGTKRQRLSYGGGRVDYALPVEAGTSKQAAQPFLRPGGYLTVRRLMARGMRVRRVS